MKVIQSKNVVNLIRCTLNCVDPRLIGHGEQVAFIVACVLRDHIEEKELIDLAILALLHDIGAYKTEDIDKMVEFESNHVWGHSVYGYLFLKKLSPLSQYADAILYHHMTYKESLNHPELEIKEDSYSALFYLADRLDILSRKKSAEFCRECIEENKGLTFSPYWIKLFQEADAKYNIVDHLKNNSYISILDELLEKARFSQDQKREYLTLIAYSIDFRSEFMVLHTVTTVCASRFIAETMGLSKEEQRTIFYGALLHDVGKVSTPIEILEKPGRLTDEEMNIMKKHVEVTGTILGNNLNSDILKNAVRHHEKLDGSGYPEGLKGDQLSISQRIVAIADIISALLRKRSYKEAYDKKSVMDILQKMAEDNKTCPEVTKLVLDNFDIMEEKIEIYGSDVLQLYQSISEEYKEISARLPEDH